jgi:hypothetical protein
MSLKTFQRALADLIASPALCRALRADPQPVIGQYELSPREARRLIDVVWQRGMSVNCTLYRVNRITPIYTLLPRTCFLLAGDLTRQVDLFWADYERTDLQFKHEIGCFAEFIRGRLRSGAIVDPYLSEVLEFEVAANALRFLPRRQIKEQIAQLRSEDEQGEVRLHPLMRVVRFDHEPAELLQSLTEMRPPHSISAPHGEYYLLLDVSGEELEVKRLDIDGGRLLRTIETDAAPLDDKDAEALMRDGFVVRMCGSESIPASEAVH